MPNVLDNSMVTVTLQTKHDPALTALLSQLTVWHCLACMPSQLVCVLRRRWWDADGSCSLRIRLLLLRSRL
jgi:hypothetical protein